LRALRFLFFLACAAVIAGGIWYVQNGGFGEEEEDVGEDEEGFGERVDGGAARRRQKRNAPRLKSKAKEAPHARSGPPRQAGGPAPAGPSGMSYEAAIAGNNLKLAPGTKDAPDLTDAELAGPMRDGSFLDACGVPSSTHVTVKVAIRNGHAVGVSVYPVPPNAYMAGCVERHVRGLRWPPNAKMDSFITTY
jgi:hypothetical protein